MFTVFKRAWYIRNQSGDLIPGPGPMHIIRRNLTEEQAREFCKGCMSGDTCVDVMHDEPCRGKLADEIGRLRAAMTQIQDEGDIRANAIATAALSPNRDTENEDG